MISLGVGRFELDWGKDEFFRNHSKLFLPGDIKVIPYYYAYNVVEYKEGYSRKLKDVKPRLELLGYSNAKLRTLYEFHIESMLDYYPEVPITFDQFSEILLSLDVSRILLDEGRGEYDWGEFVSEYLFKDKEFNKKVNLDNLLDREFGEVFGQIDPYITLRILMENPANQELELQWRYADVLEGGYTTREKLHEHLEDKEKILIVTEGSSDLFVISRAIEILSPHIADFFYFVDMQEHYPFTGTGNLHKFCQGLTSIKIQNNVLVVYDNDVAGVNKFNLSKGLELPQNMKIIKLPDHDDFKKFPTVGPNGKSVENINGLAVSIECFLDLNYNTSSPPCVRWTSYDSNTRNYQGELINKDEYVRQFKQVKSLDGEYDFKKLRYLIEHLYNEWILSYT